MMADVSAPDPPPDRRGLRDVLRTWVDPFVVLIVAVLVAGLLLPVRGEASTALGHVQTGGVVLLFGLYGARMATGDVWDGLRNLRLQGAMLVATYVVFPLVGLLVQLLPDAVLAPDLRTGMLFCALLPSTVQSSVVFTSVARGNVAGAITGATASNLLGVLVTPVLVGLLMHGSGTPFGGSVVAILLQLVLPFAVGQLLQPWVGVRLRARPRVLRWADRSVILLVVYVSVSEAQTSGAWAHVTAPVVGVLLAVCAAVLATMLTVTWWSGGRLALTRGDRIALLMCGSKKSLATGLPMAAVMFPAAVAASVALPVIVFHQLQLATCAVVARRLARSTS